MIIQFDENVTQPQAQGIILLLQSLYPTIVSSHPVNSLTPAASPRNEEEAIFGTTTQTPPSDAPTPINDQPKRTRRTKAEIAAATGAADADEAAAKQASTPAAEVTLQTAIESTTEPQPTAKPITKEELTALVNGYISRHSMEDAIATLRDFGCSRINEALAMDPAKLADLAEKLRG